MRAFRREGLRRTPQERREGLQGLSGIREVEGGEVSQLRIVKGYWRLDGSWVGETERDEMATRRSDLCLQCDTEMQQMSGQKRMCRKCGALLTCCDTV